MSHGDSITRLPEGFTVDRPDRTRRRSPGSPPRSGTSTGSSSIPRSSTRRAAATSCATSSLGIAGAAPDWTPANFIEQTVAGDPRAGRRATRAATGSDGLVICALSGGVDSAVAAALVHRAVGDRLTCIYVDHGLMRKKESELLRGHLRARPRHATSSWSTRGERFLARLAGVEDPEQKRKIIGDEFIRVFEEEATTSSAGSTS